MSKRKYEDAESVETAGKVPTPKKVKKDKSKSKDAAVQNEVASDAAPLSKEERKALKKAKKEAEKSKSKEVSPEASGSASDAEDEKAQQKALRKAEKKARKLAEQETANDTTEAPSDSKLLDKAARKAAKKAAKAAKKNGNDTTATTTPSNGASSVAQSNDASSATSPEPTTSPALNTTDAQAYLKANQITIDEDASIKTAALPPMTSFSQLPFGSEEERAPFASFKAPTPIQAATWPYLLAGRDAIGVAETGSGKTWAFGVPCIRFIKQLPKESRRGVKAVIVSPTRELALQIQEQLEKLAGPARLKVICVYGGVDKAEQRAGLKKANIVVATPGRLNDLLQEGAADISNAQYVVLDEADRMLDKGFEEDVRKIIGSTSTDRQTLMFTATWPQSVRDLASTFMKTPVRILIGDNPDGELRANTRIQQIVEVITPDQKNYRLLQLLRQYQSGDKKNDRILIFCLYKKEAQRVHEYLQAKNFKVAGIHGDMSQNQRIASLGQFKSGSSTLLVATDVAARGLDIPAVKVVINVTFPLTAEDYVHRIGRTGRAGQDGIAVTLFTEHDKANSGALVNVLRAANQPVPEDLLKFGTSVKKKEHAAYGAFYKDVDMTKKATKITFD